MCECVYERERESVRELIFADRAAERRHAVRLLHSIRTRRGIIPRVGPRARLAGCCCVAVCCVDGLNIFIFKIDIVVMIDSWSADSCQPITCRYVEAASLWCWDA